MARNGIRMQGQMIMAIDMPLLVISAFLFHFTISDGNLSIFEAILLFSSLIIFLINSMRSDKDEGDEARPSVNWKHYALLIGGGAGVALGADLTMRAVIELSKIFSIPSEVIAVSMIALGTSLPELVVSLSAAKKGKTEMAVGNVLGSNIFNTYAVMAIPRFFGDLEIPPEFLKFHLPFMVGITIVFAVISMHNKIPRFAGAMLLILYGFFMVTLFGG